jgi:hypothetical protein
MSHEDNQPRRDSKPQTPDKQQPASDMNERAKGGDKESNEPLRSEKEGDNRQPQSSPGTKPGP